MTTCTVRISSPHADSLARHLFPGDGQEHAAVLAATPYLVADKLHLLVRDLVLARDGVDHAARGHIALTADFVRDTSAFCAENDLVYLSAHNHGGANMVSFSPIDLSAHERLYPTLQQLTGNPVGGLVYASNAVAGDIWLADRRVGLSAYTVVGFPRRDLRDRPASDSVEAFETHQRQSLLLGTNGQRILRGLKIGVIGAGGMGSLLIEFLGRLGVGSVIVVDPERLEESNLSRVVGSEFRDFRPRWPWKKATRKIDIARRVFKAANPRGTFRGIFDDFRRPNVVKQFADCDAIFLAADPPSVKLLFNQLCFQYLIPGYSVGSKVLVDPDNGQLLQATSSVRLIGPGAACLWCNGFVTPAMLTKEATSAEQLAVQKYVNDPAIQAPSVITLNAQAAGYAANLFLFMTTDLGAPPDHEFTTFDALNSSVIETRALKSSSACRHCISRMGHGPSGRLSTLAK